MSPLKGIVAAAVLLCGLSQHVAAADYSDPTWPCVQRKVETLSLGLMWPYVVEKDTTLTNEQLERDIDELADLLALRRVELEDLRPDVENFVSEHQAGTEELGLVFEKVFTTLSTRRSRIINGIGTFSLGQIDLAEKIDSTRLEMAALLDQDDPDFDRIDVLEEQLDWDQVIHSDRQRSVQYLCETPQLIERRLFSIAQLLQQVGP